MKKTVSNSKDIEQAKKRLGKKIKMLRESKKDNISQNALAKEIGLPRSNMKYIEDGVNAPTATVYDAIISYLNPNDKMREEMDNLFTTIRGTPPPDICKIVCDNKALYSALRELKDIELSEEQTQIIINTLKSVRGEK